ncbi:MAG: 16S rRNA (guanine(966)-N(2))-methyltransferase RsmD [Nitrosomonas sp.]|nr:MAG: 16S rRNA (guanine(966)-N(2))-methyltransferase RsmD [Nitrosomonas sp.]
MAQAAGSRKIRIVGGQWRSRLLTFPEYSDLRPTADRIRETLFNWLGQDLSGLHCLDLFAGSGALGFEAASRGAAHVVMVDSNTRVFRALQENREKLQAVQVELVMANAADFIRSDTRQFDIIFLDPPFRLDVIPVLLPQLTEHLGAKGLVYAESRGTWPLDPTWHIKRSAKAGAVHYQLLELKSHA